MSRPSDPRPEQLLAEVDGLLARSRRLVKRDATERAATWRRLEARLGRRPTPKGLVIRWPRVGIAAAAVAALSAAGVTVGRGQHWSAMVRSRMAVLDPHLAPAAAKAPPVSSGSWRTGWQETDLGFNGKLIAAPEARFRLPSDATSAAGPYVIALERGEICVQVAHRDPVTQGPFMVETSQLRAVAVGTRFCVFAGSDAAASWVMVEEGKVRVERGSDQSRLAEAGMVVHAGELQAPTASPPSPVPSPLRHVPAPLSSTSGFSCPLAPRNRRDACLWRKTNGTGLSAQNALYLLGAEADRDQQPGRALAIWQSYVRRFPNGILGAEAAFNAFEDLLGEKRFDEALVTADDLLAHHAGFARAGEVRLRRGELLRTTFGRPQEALVEYRRILSGESRDLLREDALFGIGLCEEQLGDRGVAQATWEAYLREFPSGRYRAEVRAHRPAN